MQTAYWHVFSMIIFHYHFGKLNINRLTKTPFRLTQALLRLSRTLFRQTKVQAEGQSAVRICYTPVPLSKNISGIRYILYRPKIKIASNNIAIPYKKIESLIAWY